MNITCDLFSIQHSNETIFLLLSICNLMQWHSPLTWTVLGGHTEAAKCIVAHAKKHGARIFGKNEVSNYFPVL